MKTIPLGHNRLAFVDDEDFELVSKYHWFARVCNHTMYAVANIRLANGKYSSLIMHRLIMGAQKGQLVDHRDCNGLNNCRYNLRFCNSQENHFNQRKTNKKRSSKYKGVSLFKRDNNYSASIGFCGRKLHIGYYNTEKEAAIARNKVELELFGDFAHLNVIEE
jgi:hypothetical protein